MTCDQTGKTRERGARRTRQLAPDDVSLHLPKITTADTYTVMERIFVNRILRQRDRFLQNVQDAISFSQRETLINVSRGIKKGLGRWRHVKKG